MKKLIATIVSLVLITTLLASCTLFPSENSGGENELDEVKKIRIGYMQGPTGMGMAKLVADNGGLDNGNEKYSFTKYADTNMAKGDLAGGKIDIICLPTNEAANYYTKTDDNIVVLAINCLNSLYLLTSGETKVSSLSDLEGQTVYTCKNGTPRIVLEYLIAERGLDIKVSYEIDDKVILTPDNLSTCLVDGSIPNAVIPEPLVTSSLLSIAKNGNESISYTVDIDLADEWSKISDTPIAMGCIVANADFVKNNPKTIEAFLGEYKASVDYIGNPDNLDSASNYVVKTGVMGAAPAAKKALSNLGDAIKYIDGSDMKSTLVSFFEAIGVAVPDDEFFYE